MEILSESIWARGRADTKYALGTLRFWAVDLIGGGIMSKLFNDTTAIIFIVGLVIVLWIVTTASAPFRQRNELRTYIQDYLDGQPHLKILDLDFFTLDDRSHVRIKILNDSLIDAAGIDISLIESTPRLTGVISNFQGSKNNPIDLPLILVPQQRLRSNRESKTPIPPFRFNMAGGKINRIELFYAKEDVALSAVIEHQGGFVRFPVRNVLFKYEINGCGPNIYFWVQILTGPNGAWKPFLITDIDTFDKESLDVPWETPEPLDMAK